MRKVIFLDIDGVINSEINQDYNFKKGRWSTRNIVMDPEAMLCIKEIVDKTGAEIVLASTWRYADEDGSFASKENFVKQLNEFGMVLADETPQLSEYNRAEEIIAYLKAHPEITHFLIIDDDIDLLKNNELKVNLLHTNYQVGLVKSEVENAVAILANQREC